MKNKKQQEKKEEPTEIESTGYFEFSNNTYYEGGYKTLLPQGHKIRHGHGKLVSRGINNSSIGEEYYIGNWLNDKFNGYGEYKYSNGDEYKGDFKDGLFNGNGVYICCDGTKYEGQFLNHKFHGSGTYYDFDNIAWKGEYRDGYFSSKDQAILKEERRITNKVNHLANCPITEFYKSWEEIITKVDKKTAKDHLLVFFGDKETLGNAIKEPYPKFEDKTYDKWNEVLKFAFTNTQNYQAFVGGTLENNTFKFIEGTRILSPQFTEELSHGQVVETLTALGDRNVYLAFAYNKTLDKWQMIYFKDETVKHKK